VPPDPALAARLRDRLVEVVGILSPSHEERALADHYQGLLERQDAWRTERIGENLVVEPAADVAGPRVLITGHLDTVPANGNTIPRVDGDRVYGLGSSDLKAGLGVMQELWETLDPAACGLVPVFVLYAREEIGYAESGLEELVVAAPRLKDAAFAICVEPTGNVVELGCLGTLHAQVTVRGQAAHSARPWLGKNAVHAALPLLQRVAERPERPVPFGPDGSILYREVMNVTSIQGGHAMNVLPHTLVMNVNFRFGPDRTPDDACAVMEELFAADAEVEITDLAPAGRVCSDNPHCQALVALSGVPARAKQAWTDVGRMSGWGLDAVSIGPGIPEQAHQQGEYATVSAMLDHHRILAAWLTQRPETAA